MPIAYEPSHIWTYESRVCFYLGSMPIYWYGLFMALGFFAAIVLSVVKIRFYYKIQVFPFYFFIFVGTITSIFGARLWSCVIGNAQWSQFFNIRSGGIAIQGGVILTIFAALIFFNIILRTKDTMIRDEFHHPIKVKKVSLGLYFDAVIPTILIGQVIGRWGNYFNQELYGAVVDANGSLARFLSKYLPYMSVSGQYHQPLFLWEGLINFGGLVLIYIFGELIRKKKVGDLSFAYLAWYGIVRLCLEPLREAQFSFGLTYFMTISWIVVGICGIILNHLLISFWGLRQKNFSGYVWTQGWQALLLALSFSRKVNQAQTCDKQELDRFMIQYINAKNFVRHFIFNHKTTFDAQVMEKRLTLIDQRMAKSKAISQKILENKKYFYQYLLKNWCEWQKQRDNLSKQLVKQEKYYFRY